VRCSARGGGAFAEGLPEGWASADNGAPGQAGSAAYNAETQVWTVQGGGADVWDQSDHSHFAYLTRGDHFDARARVSSLQNTNGWAKAGLEIRATTDTGSIHAMLVGTPGNGTAVQWRSNTNDYMSHSGVGAADFPNVWVRLTRNGNTVTAYKATDAAGENWQEVARLNLALPDSVLVGLLVTAHDDAQLCTATFDGVQVYDVPQGSGTGLAGTYSNDITFSDPVLARVDPVVDFNWGGGAPDSTVNADFFTVRWQGQVEAQFSETYTFTTRTDDGVRLWVDGQLLVDKWVGQGATEWSGSVALVAGQKYDLKMEYVEFWGDAVAQLYWRSPSTPKQIIPQSQLYPDPDIRVAPTVLSTAPADGGQLEQLAAAISVTFSRPMNHGATESAFALTPAASGTFSWDGNTMTFVPTSLLAAETPYTATVGTAARDIGGNALAAEHAFAFTTGIAPGNGDGLAGYYSNGRDFTQIVLRRVDPTVNFNWGQG
jgi:hypothetical protein